MEVRVGGRAVEIREEEANGIVDSKREDFAKSVRNSITGKYRTDWYAQ